MRPTTLILLSRWYSVKPRLQDITQRIVARRTQLLATQLLAWRALLSASKNSRTAAPRRSRCSAPPKRSPVTTPALHPASRTTNSVQINVSLPEIPLLLALQFLGRAHSISVEPIEAKRKTRAETWVASAKAAMRKPRAGFLMLRADLWPQQFGAARRPRRLSCFLHRLQQTPKSGQYVKAQVNPHRAPSVLHQRFQIAQ